jgi:hypothetical protein
MVKRFRVSRVYKLASLPGEGGECSDTGLTKYRLPSARAILIGEGQERAKVFR